ncbi:MAG: DUF4215 domain-containing protein [Deltaproteobacteria bacterium]|nr:DUF4215 domain-containing protein [Deltaproteobacteria bacterium]
MKWFFNIRGIVLAALVYGLFFPVILVAQTYNWSTATLDSAIGAGTYSSLALSDNAPAIAYVGESRRLKFISQRGGGWSTPINLTAVYDRLEDVSLLSTSAGNLCVTLYGGHISTSCVGSCPPVMGVATLLQRSGSWPALTTVIDGSKTESAGSSAALALSSSGVPHVIYRHDDNDFRLYNSRYNTSTSSWVTPAEVIAQTMLPQLSLLIDSAANLHAFYTRVVSSKPQLFYHLAPFNGLAYDWSGPTTTLFNHEAMVTTTTSPNFYKDALLSSGGVVHIAFYQPNGGELRFATIGSAGTTLIDGESSDAGLYTSLTECPNGSLHISYYDATVRSLKHASRERTESTWRVETIEDPMTANPASSDVGQYTSIACDSNNTLHISYYDAGRQVLKYAKGARPAAVTTGCGNASCDAGESCSTCSADCGACPPEAICGDGTCNGEENCSTCERDCSACPPVRQCGNGITEPDEQCDDSNTSDGDGCDSRCQNEATVNETQTPLGTPVQISNAPGSQDEVASSNPAIVDQGGLTGWRAAGSGCSLIR